MRENTVEIEFMYLDLETCDRCRETENNLEEAIKEVSSILEKTGRKVNTKKIHIQSEEQAKKLGFVSSPTIRVNGRDIQMEVKESPCDPCGDICGDSIDCRIWTYQGKEYTAPPKAMIIDAILREVYGGIKASPRKEQRLDEIPDNLKRFFQGKKRKETSCCCSGNNNSCC